MKNNYNKDGQQLFNNIDLEWSKSFKSLLTPKNQMSNKLVWVEYKKLSEVTNMPEIKVDTEQTNTCRTFFLSYFHFIVVLNTVMNKVLVQTLSDHGGAPVKMLRSSKIHKKNETFQLWEEHRYVFKVQHSNYERSDCRTKAAQIFHQ